MRFGNVFKKIRCFEMLGAMMVWSCAVQWVYDAVPWYAAVNSIVLCRSEVHCVDRWPALCCHIL